MLNRLKHYYKNFKRRGWWVTLKYFYSYIILPSANRTFIFKKSKYKYFVNRYSFTWTNERSIEVPIFKRILDKALDKKESVLEVGCVLNHYYKNDGQWIVVDKYEKYEGSINADICDFKKGKYDTIISISTMEHVGFEEDGDCSKFGKALKNIATNLLKDGGVFIFSIPLGYNKVLDDQIFSNKYKMKVEYLHRESVNSWKESNIGVEKEGKYNFPYESANDLAICYFKK